MNLKFEGYAIVDGFISVDTYFCFYIMKKWESKVHFWEMY